MQIPATPINYSLIPTVNSSDYWDNLNTPADINTGDLTNDGTYLMTGGNLTAYNGTFANDLYVGGILYGNSPLKIGSKVNITLDYAGTTDYTGLYMNNNISTATGTSFFTTKGTDNIVTNPHIISGTSPASPINYGIVNDLTISGEHSVDAFIFEEENYANKILMRRSGTVTSDGTISHRYQSFGVHSTVVDSMSYNFAGKSVDAYNYGGYFLVSQTGTETAGTMNKNNYGLYTYVNGGSSGTTTNYGLYIDTVSGDTNYAIYDNSGANWVLDGDNQKIIIGEGQDSSIYYDGTNMVINPKEQGSGYLNVSGDLSVGGTGTFGDNVNISYANDGGEVSLYLKNTAGSGSSDENVSIIAQTTTSNYPMGKMSWTRRNSYGPPDERDSEWELYIAEDDAYFLAMRYDYPDTALVLDNIQATGEISSNTVSAVDLISTGKINAVEIYNPNTNFDIQPDAEYNVDVFADGTISNSADGKVFKVHRNAVSETDSAVQLYNDRYSRPAIYGYGDDFLFYIPDDDIVIYSANGDIDLQGGSSGDITMFEFAASGENPSLRQGGYITNGANEVEVSWTVKDTDDYFWLERENTNIKGLKIDMPIYMPNDNDMLVFGAGDDASIYFDGTNLVINPANLGAGGTAIGVEGSPNAFLEATGNGAIAGGYATRSISGSGTIKSSGFGSIALGYAGGFFNDVYLQAKERGSIAMGWAYMNNITSSGTGSVAMGDGSNGPIVASNSGAFALGSNVEATAARAMVLGNGVNNNIANTLMIGFNDEDLRVQDDNVTIYGNLTIQGNLEVAGCIIYNGGSLGSCV